jgi:hypothetical protein
VSSSSASSNSRSRCGFCIYLKGKKRKKRKEKKKYIKLENQNYDKISFFTSLVGCFLDYRIAAVLPGIVPLRRLPLLHSGRFYSAPNESAENYKLKRTIINAIFSL